VGAGELGLAVEAPLAGAAVCARGAGVPHLEEPARLKPLINQSREEKKKETIFRWVAAYSHWQPQVGGGRARRGGAGAAARAEPEQAPL